MSIEIYTKTKQSIEALQSMMIKVKRISTKKIRRAKHPQETPFSTWPKHILLFLLFKFNTIIPHHHHVLIILMMMLINWRFLFEIRRPSRGIGVFAGELLHEVSKLRCTSLHLHGARDVHNFNTLFVGWRRLWLLLVPFHLLWYVRMIYLGVWCCIYRGVDVCMFSIWGWFEEGERCGGGKYWILWWRKWKVKRKKLEWPAMWWVVLWNNRCDCINKFSLLKVMCVHCN